MKWTSKQLDAINGDGNLLVSAAAGSGKTAVLTERITRLIVEGASVGDFLCVTFTNAAAGEMKKRIEKRLMRSAGETTDENERARLHDAALSVGGANVSTLHSFCVQVLRRHFHEAGLDPAFRVGDEAETLVLRHEVWDEVCERRYAEDSGMFAELIDRLGGNEDTVRDMLLQLYAFLCSQVEPLNWLKNAIAQYGMDDKELEVSSAVSEVLRSAKLRLLAACDTLSDARDMIIEDAPNAANQLGKEIISARGLLKHTTYEAYRKALLVLPAFERINWKGADGTAKENCIKARDHLKKVIAADQEMFQFSLAQEAQRMHAQQRCLDELYLTMVDFFESYASAKSERSLIDYNDMEHMALRLLEKEHIAAEYIGRFKHIFIDEYQDSNRVQEAIISCIRPGEGLFLVGDVKQSIYRFRMAEPELFLARYDAYTDNEGGTAIDLNSNFRSDAKVINFVNALFAEIMHRETMEIEYDSSAALYHGRTDESGLGAVELHVTDLGLQTAGSDGDESEAERVETVEAECAIAAKRIHTLMAEKQIADEQTGEMRALKYSDFAVLLRSPRDIAESWTQGLAHEGIPAYAELTGGFFDAVEVQVFLNLLRILDNRRQDIPLASVLRSPIGGFSTDELAWMRATYPKDSFLDTLIESSLRRTDTGKKAAAFLAKLDEWHEYSSLLSVEELIGLLLDETGYLSFCRALNGGRQREANLNAISERARLYEKSGVRGLASFLAFMEKIASSGSLGAAQTAGADVVRVLSAHKSKGLEFPVVILAGLDKQFNLMDTNRRILFEGELGIGIKLTDNGVVRGSIYSRAIALRIKRKSIAEEMRVLYVALTRAKERLILICATPNAEKRVSESINSFGASRASEAKRFSSWLVGLVGQSADGNALHMGGLPASLRTPRPSLGVEAQLHYTFGGKLLDKRMPKHEYEKITRRARADGSKDYAHLFDRAYPFIADTQIPSKLTVSALSDHVAELSEAPRFVQGESMSAADRGTAAHALMQHIALHPHDYASVKSELMRLQNAGIMSDAQVKAVHINSIVGFFASELGKRLLASNKVLREVEFNHRVSASALIDAPTDAPILLQGVIDCCFIENGEWVLVDYKTDYVPEGTKAQAVALKHARQVQLYAEALHALSGRAVKEKYVHLLRSGDSVKV